MYMYRTLKIKRSLEQLDRVEREKLEEMLRRVERTGMFFVNLMRTMGIEKAKQHIDAYVAHVSPELKYFAGNLKYFASELAKMYGEQRRKKALFKVRAIFDVQVRTKDERDTGRGIFIDLRKSELRIRRIIPRKAVVVRLSESEKKYIEERLREGASPVYGSVFADSDYLYVTISFRRRVEPIAPQCVLAVDVNSLAYGVTYGVIKNGKVSIRRIEPPKITTHTSKMSRRSREFATKAAREIIQVALSHRCEIWIDTPKRSSIEELLKNGLQADKKIILYGVRRFTKKLLQTAKWYGVPVKFVRLPSSLCPRCGAKLDHYTVDGGRLAHCRHCGFAAERDVVPMMWAAKRFNENKPPSFSSSLLLLPAY